MSWRTARTPPMTSPAATPRPPRQLPPPPRTPCLPRWKEPPQPPPPQCPQPTRGRRRGSPRPRHPPGTKSVPSSRSKTVKKLSRSDRGKCRLLEAETETRKVEAPPPPPRRPPPLHRQTLRRVRHERCDDRFPSLLYWLNDGVAAEKWHFYFVKNYLYTDFGKGQTNSGDY